MRSLWLRPLARVVLFTLSLLATGCVNLANRAGGNRVAVVLSVSGGTAPTAEQWALVTTAVRPQLEARGMVLVKNLADADRIIHIDFTPDPLSSNTAGNAVVLGWRVNPLGPLAYVGTPGNLTQVNYSSGFSVYNRAMYGYDRFPDNYYGYGYGNSYYTGGTTSVTPVTPPLEKPKPSPPIKPGEECPPGSTPTSQRNHGRLAGGDPPEHGHSGYRPRPPLPPPEHRFPLSLGEGSSSSRSSSTYASSSGSSSSGSNGSSGSSSNSGGSSYSSGSSSSGSSSYSGSSSSSGSSGSSGGGSSSGFSSSRSSGTSESASPKQN